MSSTWSRFTAQNAEQFAFLVRRSRELIGALELVGAGVFRERGSLALFFSPAASDIVRVLQLPAAACAAPEQMRVEIVAGPYDEVGQYDATLEEFRWRMMDDYLDELDEFGLEPPEEFWNVYRPVGG